MNQKAAFALCMMLIETVEETGPRGAPGGVMYAALMGKLPNLSASEFNRLMEVCCSTKKIEKRGDCYYPVGK